MAGNRHLNATITIGGTISAGLKAAFTSTKKQIKGVGDELKKLNRAQTETSRAIQTFGRMGKNVDNLRTRYADLTRQITRLRTEQERLTRAAERHTKLTGLATKVSAAGAVVGGAGMGMLMAAHAPIDQVKEYQRQVTQIEALGFHKKETDELLKFSKAQDAVGVSILDSTKVAKDLASAFGDVHHAVMALPITLKQTAALKLYNEGHDEKLSERAAYQMAKVIELRNGTKDIHEYNKQANMAHQVMVATGGRVNGEQMQLALRTGGIAAKGMTDKAFYYGGSHLMQEMGGDVYGTATMSLYQALAQGRVTKRAAQNLEDFGLIGDKSKVQSDKAGQLKFMNPGALLGYQTFVKDQQEWVEKYFIPTLQKHGINPDDMTKVAEIAGMIVSNRNGANLLATRVAQRGVIAKEARNAERADNIDKGYNRYSGTVQAKEAELLKRKNNLLLAIGKNALPLYVKALEITATALERVNNFVEKNPKLTNAMVVGFIGMGTALAVLGPLLIGGGGLIWGLGQFVSVGARLVPLIGMFSGGVRILGSALIFLATNPIGWTIAAIGLLAGAVYLIYKHWGPIKQWFAELWDGIVAKFNSAIDWITSKIESVGKMWSNFKSLFSQENAPQVPQAFKPAANINVPTPAKKFENPLVQHTTTNNFTVTQQPGEDSHAFAKKVAALIDRQNAVRNRSGMLDGVTA